MATDVQTPQERCDACRFYEPDTQTTGHCRRWPRAAVSSLWSLPVVCCDDWCGEWLKADKSGK